MRNAILDCYAMFSNLANIREHNKFKNVGLLRYDYLHDVFFKNIKNRAVYYS